MLAFLFITCSKLLQIFLKERGKLNLKEMTQAVDNYVEAHGHEANRIEVKQNKWNKSNTVSTDKAGQNVVRANWHLAIERQVVISLHNTVLGYY